MSTLGSPVRAYDFLLKFLLVGDSDVGKGEILASLQDGAAESPYGHPAGERGARTGEQGPGSARWAGGVHGGPGSARQAGASGARGACGGPRESTGGGRARGELGVGWGRGLGARGGPGSARGTGGARREPGSAPGTRGTCSGPGSARGDAGALGGPGSVRGSGGARGGRESARGSARRAGRRGAGGARWARGTRGGPESAEGDQGSAQRAREHAGDQGSTRRAWERTGDRGGGGAHGGRGGAGPRHQSSAPRSSGCRDWEKGWSAQRATDQGARGSWPASLPESGARFAGVPCCTPSSARGEHSASSIVSPRSASPRELAAGQSAGVDLTRDDGEAEESGRTTQVGFGEEVAGLL